MKIHLSLLLLLCIGMWGCKNELPLEERIAESAYPDGVGEIILTSCSVEGCHVTESPPESLDLSSWAAAYEGSNFGSVIIPGEAQWSHLFQHVNTFEDLGIRATPTMPEEAEEYLNREQVTTILDWIEDGAKDRNGNNYWAQQETRSGGKLFTLCAGSDLIAVSDIATNRIMRFIPVGNSTQLEAPHFIILSPDQQYIYVSLIAGNLLEKYRADTYEFVGRVTMGASPALIATNASGSRAVVSHFNDASNTSKLSMIDLENMSLVDEIVGGGTFYPKPHGLKVTANFDRVYVVMNGGNYYSVFEMDESGFNSVETYPVDPDNSPDPAPSTAYAPYQIHLLEEDSLIFISCSASDEVRVMHAVTNELLAVIPVGNYPRLMDYDPVSEQLFVACRSEENFPEQGSLEGCVSVIDVANLTFVKNIYRVGHRPHGVSVDAANRMLYVSSENTGGADPPHHPLEGNTSPPGKYNVVDIATLLSLPDEETEVAEFPNALVVSGN